MQRREILKIIGASAAIGATGCMGQNNADNEEQISLTDTEFEVINIQSGTEKNESTPDFDEETNEVTVTGVISGNNSCYTARLDSSNYNEENDVLTMNIESYEDSEEGEMCAQSIVEIEYEATAIFEGGLPGSVDIKHNGESVSSASFESTSASTSN